MPAEPLLEAAVPIPDQFKQLVRRSQKQLLKEHHDALAAKYNEFIAALNAGKNEDDLMDLSDELADIFDAVRR